jgi:hypothetical protein
MVKAPVAGRVKTRLAEGVGVASATAFYRSTCASVLDRLGRTRRWRTWLAVTPDAAVASRWWPRHLARLAQGRGDLGRRLQHPIDHLPPGPVVIVGTDIPAIRQTDIADAFRRLGSADAVLGPATDGGYWLIGLRRAPRILRPFEGVRWSSAHALADTEARLADRRVARAKILSDVDEPGDLAAVAAWCGRRVLPVGIGTHGSRLRMPDAAGRRGPSHQTV